MIDDARESADLNSLAELREALEALGLVVVPFGDELHIRLSMLEYIKVRIRAGSLHCAAWAGWVPRARASWTLLGVCALLIPALFLETGVTPETLAVGFLGIAALVFGSLRHLLSDNTITRIGMAWLGIRHRVPLGQGRALPDDSSALQQLGAGTPESGERRHTFETLRRRPG